MDLGELVGHGMVFTGMFALFARNLFVDGNGVVNAAGEATVQGRRALHFTYRTPSLTSRWFINWEGRIGQVGEAGQFWVDAQDFHLLRLAVSGQDIPPQLLLESLDLVVDYQMSGAGETATLVPAGGSFTAVELGGKKYLNMVEFSHCHIFEAESRLAASDEPMADTLTRYKRQMGTLPAGVNLLVGLQEPIGIHTARVGDPVTARLEQTVKISPGLSVPAGSILRGRIRQFERLEQPANTFQVGIAFAELESEQVTYRFFAEMIGMEPLPGISSQLTTNRSRFSASMAGSIQSMSGETVVPIAIPGAAVFFLSDTPFIPKGFRMTWRTSKMAR